MSDYAASALLRPGPVRTRAAGRQSEPNLAQSVTPGRPVELVTLGEVGRRERWLADARISWAQTTFFLFHEEGWR